MIIALFLVGAIFAFTFVTFVVGMTLRDVHAMRLSRNYRRHPYAAQFRARPLVSVIIDGEPTAACLQSIRRSDYNKIQIVANGQTVDGTLILTMSSDTQLERTAISSAVRELMSNPKLGLVELLPSIRQPQSTRQLFDVYRAIAAAPFMSVRSGLRVTLPLSSCPTIIRPESFSMTRQTKLYLIGRWFVQCAAIVTLLYAAYLALMIYQPEFLLLYLAAFGLWLVWSILRYPYFSPSQKMLYFALAPVSVVSFLYWCVTAPLRLMQYAALLPTHHRDGIIAVIEL